MGKALLRGCLVIAFPFIGAVIAREALEALESTERGAAPALRGLGKVGRAIMALREALREEA